MTNDMKDAIMTSVKDFRMPRYAEIPDVGLYLEQTVKYISEFLAPLGDVTITGSMVSNYVKMKLIPSPERKQYSREQIAKLLMISIAKSVIALDNVRRLLEIGKGYDARSVYDYFAAEFENLLLYVFDVKDVADEILPEQRDGVELMRNLILTAANKIYLDKCFAQMADAE